MKVISRIGCLPACLLAVVRFTTGASGHSSTIDVDEQLPHRHASGLMAIITLRGGASRNVKLEGVGCPQSICSRTQSRPRLSRIR